MAASFKQQMAKLVQEMGIQQQVITVICLSTSKIYFAYFHCWKCTYICRWLRRGPRKKILIQACKILFYKALVLKGIYQHQNQMWFLQTASYKITVIWLSSSKIYFAYLHCWKCTSICRCLRRGPKMKISIQACKLLSYKAVVLIAIYQDQGQMWFLQITSYKILEYTKQW